MIVGFKAQQRQRRVIGIDASAKPEETRAAVPDRSGDRDLVELGQDITEEDVILEPGYAGIYGIPTAGTLDAIRMAARLEGMITDPVYEGNRWRGSSTWYRGARSTEGRRCCTRISAVSRR